MSVNEFAVKWTIPAMLARKKPLFSPDPERDRANVADNTVNMVTAMSATESSAIWTGSATNNHGEPVSPRLPDKNSVTHFPL